MWSTALALSLAWVGGAGCAGEGDGALMSQQGFSTQVVGFSINKWLTADGTQRSPVGGVFDGVTVQLSGDISTVTSLEGLAGLSATITVDLSTLNTQHAIRDENIEVHYFQVPTFSTATFVVSNVRPLGTGAFGTVVADGVLTLMGASVAFPNIELDVGRTPTGWVVDTRSPLVVRHQDFGIDPLGLITFCGHAGLDAEAYVSAQLTL